MTKLLYFLMQHTTGDEICKIIMRIHADGEGRDGMYLVGYYVHAPFVAEIGQGLSS